VFAEPNCVVIAESTRKLVGNLFELQDLGAQDLKGITGPVRAWAALRPSSVESRFDALHAGTLTELVGREEELELLLRRWSKAKAGEGQVVLLSGEPGIGKSRLTAALMERLDNEPHTRLRYFFSGGGSLARFAVHIVQPVASYAGDRFIAFAVIRSIVRNEALDAITGVRAAVEKWWHRATFGWSI
jgi:AAA ATPase domain